jgi:hypothetical protein
MAVAWLPPGPGQSGCRELLRRKNVAQKGQNGHGINGFAPEEGNSGPEQARAAQSAAAGPMRPGTPQARAG